MYKKKLAYLGPGGTFSEEAALCYSSSYQRQMVEYPTLTAVIRAVCEKETEEGLVPFENSLEGGVGATLDQLARQEGLYIRHELTRPVRQCLMSGEKWPLTKIKTIYSHPHALGQCTEYLDLNLPHAEHFTVESTAAAAVLAAQNAETAAIAPRRAAAIYHLALLAENIQDNLDNSTRFVVLGRSDHPPTGRDKTSLVFTIPDGPGSLHKILGYFARRAINLTRIESRPSRRIAGDWLFFVDCEGHRFDQGRKELWEEIEKEVSFFKLLGSYPCNSYT
ncbi:MAG TPA: prephenate dehydratase, partial [Firmicutes bacterium]|nr:prephenate dehydratase [Bacillota bacterium]